MEVTFSRQTMSWHMYLGMSVLSSILTNCPTLTFLPLIYYYDVMFQMGLFLLSSLRSQLLNTATPSVDTDSSWYIDPFQV